jgi:biopolymer transport protein ExbD
MARTFRRKHATHPIAELNVTNLIDLGFMLLIIFMVAASVIKNEQTIPVNLPVESKSPQEKPDKDIRFVAIAVDAKGNFFLDGKPTPLTVPELRTRLRAYATEAKPPIMRVRGDGDVSYKRIVQLTDELKRANLLKFTLDTQTGG